MGSRVSPVRRLKGHLALMRPWNWVWFDVFPASVLSLLLAPASIRLGEFALFLAAVMAADAGVNTLNDLCDVETDRRSTEPSRRQRPLVTGEVRPRAAGLQAALLYVLAIGLGLLVSTKVALCVASLVVAGIAYSVPPVRLCARPWSAQPFWLGFGLLAYATVAAFAGAWFTWPTVLWGAAMGFFFVGGETLSKDIRDWDNDAAAGRRTWVVTAGPRRAVRASTALSLLGGGLFATLIWWLPQLHLGARLAGTVALLVWAAQALRFGAALARAYDKGLGARLHATTVGAYLVVNASLAGGLWWSR